ncbi:AAA family ATPase [Lichenibacterium dinghuense]|uniref:AAA family ATPase n=1 Tax=Lichenibacterium dinghuense TaxID=2895977 RepID=UPI001F2BE2A9|nr:AAA family ATPase [Lichenibacterium sp. 6Y81]
MNEQPQPERQTAHVESAEVIRLTQPETNTSDVSAIALQQDEDGEEPLPLPARPRERSMLSLLASAAFEGAMGAALMHRLRTPGDGLCICVGVPDASWEGPLREMAAEVGRPVRIMFRDAAARPSSDYESTVSAIRWLQGGAAVLCVSQDVRTGVRPEFHSVADATIRVQAPNPAMIAGVISALHDGRKLRRIPSDLGQGLTLHEIAACLRLDEAGRRTVARLQRAQRAKGSSAVDADGPRLEDLAGYGTAADWGKGLREGIAEYRAGRVPWRQLDAQALLYGPPGTGKSWFAPALARSLDVRCIRTSVGGWFNSNAGDLGGTIKAAASVFAEARTEARARGAVVLFLDEIDGLPNRGALDAREGSWWRPVVNYVLATLDGGGSDMEGIVLVAATNDIDAVDPALLRPGRFGTHHHVGPPGLRDLASIMVHHLGGPSCPLPRNALEGVLRTCVGTAQAQVASWARTALRRARAEGREVWLAGR